jgi:transcriptional regulator with XRE-family HTH domain
MKIKNSTKTTDVLKEIGAHFTQQRVLAKLTQAGLAEKAGVSKRTVERIEAGSSIQLSTMIQVLRVFNLLESFGLALTAEEAGTPAKKKSRPVMIEKAPLTENSNKSHSWGY